MPDYELDINGRKTKVKAAQALTKAQQSALQARLTERANAAAQAVRTAAPVAAQTVADVATGGPTYQSAMTSIAKAQPPRASMRAMTPDEAARHQAYSMQLAARDTEQNSRPERQSSLGGALLKGTQRILSAPANYIDANLLGNAGNGDRTHYAETVNRAVGFGGALLPKPKFEMTENDKRLRNEIARLPLEERKKLVDAFGASVFRPEMAAQKQAQLDKAHPVKQVAESAKNVAMNLVSDPVMLALPNAGKAGAAFFGGSALAQGVPELANVVQGKSERPWQEGTSGVLNIGMGALAGLHVMPDVISKGKATAAQLKSIQTTLRRLKVPDEVMQKAGMDATPTKGTVKLTPEQASYAGGLWAGIHQHVADSVQPETAKPTPRAAEPPTPVAAEPAKTTPRRNTKTPKPKTEEPSHAIQEQEPGKSVLRAEEPKVGLQEVGKGNAKPEVTAKQGEVAPKEVKPARTVKPAKPNAETPVAEPPKPVEAKPAEPVAEAPAKPAEEKPLPVKPIEPKPEPVATKTEVVPAPKAKVAEVKREKAKGETQNPNTGLTNTQANYLIGELQAVDGPTKIKVPDDGEYSVTGKEQAKNLAESVQKLQKRNKYSYTIPGERSTPRPSSGPEPVGWFVDAYGSVEKAIDAINRQIKMLRREETPDEAKIAKAERLIKDLEVHAGRNVGDYVRTSDGIIGKVVERAPGYNRGGRLVIEDVHGLIYAKGVTNENVHPVSPSAFERKTPRLGTSDRDFLEAQIERAKKSLESAEQELQKTRERSKNPYRSPSVKKADEFAERTRNNKYELERELARAKQEDAFEKIIEEQKASSAKAEHPKVATEETAAKPKATDSEVPADHATLSQTLREEAASLPERLKSDPIKTMDEVEQAALKRIKARGGTLKSGIDPIEIADYAIVGAMRIGKGVVKIAQWSDEMVKHFGPEIKDHLRELWEHSVAYYNKHMKPNLKDAPTPENWPANPSDAPFSHSQIDKQVKERGGKPIPRDQVNSDTEMARRAAGVTIAEINKKIAEINAASDKTHIEVNSEMQKAIDEHYKALRSMSDAAAQAHENDPTEANKKKAESALKEYVKAAAAVKRMSSSAGHQLRQTQVDVDPTSFSSLAEDYASKNDGNAPDAKTQQDLLEVAGQTKKAKKKLDTVLKTTEDTESKSVADRVVEEVINDTKRAIKSEKLKEREEKAKQNFKDGLQEFLNERNKSNAPRKSPRRSGAAQLPFSPAEVVALRKMMRALIELGHVRIETIVHEMQGTLHKAGLKYTDREVMDALSGYGYPSAEPTEAQRAMADVKLQGRLLSQIEDAEKQLMPALKAAPFPPTERVKELRKMAEKAYKDAGFPPKRAMSAKSAEKMLEEAKARIREKIEEAKSRLTFPPNENQLRRTKRVMPDRPTDTELEGMQSELKQLEKDWRLAQARYGQDGRVEAYAKKINDMREKIANHEAGIEPIQPTPKRERPPVSDEVVKAALDYKRLAEKARALAEPEPPQYFEAGVAKLIQVAAISSPVVFEKLPLAGIGEQLLQVPTRIATAANAKIMGKIGRYKDIYNQTLESGQFPDMRTEIMALGTIPKAAKVAVSGLKTGQFVNMEKGTEFNTAEFNMKGVPKPVKTAINMVGRTHAAIKYVDVFSSAFERYFRYELAALNKKGETINDLAIDKAYDRAKTKALEDILQRNNPVSSVLRRFSSDLTNSPSRPVRIAGVLLTGISPVTKVPVNAILRKFDGTPVGIARGFWQLERIHADMKAGKTIDPLRIDDAWRCFGRGYRGIALLILGYTGLVHAAGNRKKGDYLPMPDREGGRLEMGDVQAGSIVLPGSLTAHSQDVFSVNLGADLRKAAMKGDPMAKRLGLLLTAADNVPLLDTVMESKDIFQSGDQNRWSKMVGNYIGNLTIPQAVQEIGRQQDKQTPFGLGRNPVIPRDVRGESDKTLLGVNRDTFMNSLRAKRPTIGPVAGKNTLPERFFERLDSLHLKPNDPVVKELLRLRLAEQPKTVGKVPTRTLKQYPGESKSHYIQAVKEDDRYTYDTMKLLLADPRYRESSDEDKRDFIVQNFKRPRREKE